MTQETVRALADKELAQVIAWARGEQRVRAEQRKHDTIAKIKEMAGAAGISVSIHSKRGRPQKAKPDAATGRAAKYRASAVSMSGEAILRP